MDSFYSHGKLLLTGEYVVLDGAKALAIPTKFGQKMTVKTLNEPVVEWKSFLSDGQLWFSQTFSLKNGKINFKISEENESQKEVITNLCHILQGVFSLSTALKNNKGYKITSFLEFPKNWGLGSSSTLVNNLANWAQINPYKLLKKTFGGSGYDIACAEKDSPIVYKMNGENPNLTSVSFQPHFSEQLFFVYLNQKKNSRDAIQHYRSLKDMDKKNTVKKIDQITQEILMPKLDLATFEMLINTHEATLSKALQTPTIKEKLFKNYQGSIKSLGGWGGDFVLATGTLDDMGYFKNLGYATIIPFNEMIFKNNK